MKYTEIKTCECGYEQTMLLSYDSETGQDDCTNPECEICGAEIDWRA